VVCRCRAAGRPQRASRVRRRRGPAAPVRHRVACRAP